ncbi:MAG: 3-phosphoglycerate dehydrogenase, partial [Ottowia sp.]|nr:3-phosphoglycerate dehydrogenase [Ottowia sp.]
DYLEHGHITNSVNYPAVRMDRTPGATRITFANDNVAGVLGHVLSVLADAKVNVIDMSNRSRDALAYNIIDVATPPQDEAIRAIGSVAHVIRVRVL